MIKIHDELFIESDGNQWIIGTKIVESRSKTAKHGDMELIGKWFYNNIDSAIRFILNHEIKQRSKHVDSLENLVDIIKETKLWLDSTVIELFR